MQIEVDIGLAPSPELAERALATSADLQKFGALFQLGEDTFFPHLSLYMLQLPKDILAEAAERLAAVADKTTAPAVVAERYCQNAGYIDAEYPRTDELAQLQMTVMEAINPLRDHLRAKDTARLTTEGGESRASIEHYGYRGAGKLFRPHLTFTRFATPETIDTDALPPLSRFDGRFVNLAMYEMGENGTCTRKLAEYKLKG